MLSALVGGLWNLGRVGASIQLACPHFARFVVTDGRGALASGVTDASGHAMAWFPAPSTFPITYRMEPPPNSGYPLITQEIVRRGYTETVETRFLFAPPTIHTQRIPKDVVAFIVGDWQGDEPDALWLANLDGTVEVKILDDVSQVAWSANGEWLAAMRHDGLWLISPDAKKQRRMLMADTARGNVVQAVWSPDNTQIAFVQANEDEVEHLGIIEIDTGQATYLSTAIAPERFTSLAWSPDGQRLAFVKGFHSIEVIEVAQREAKVLPLTWDCLGSIMALTWSPQSDRLAFWAYGNGRYAHGTACVTTLTSTVALDVKGHSTNPVWDVRGEGLYIIATNFDPDDPNLSLDPRLLYFDRSGRFVKRLASMNYGSRSEFQTLSLSPDGRWLAHLNLEYPHSIIEFVNVGDYQQLTRVVDTPGKHLYIFVAPYEWAPDSAQVLLMTGEDHTPDPGTGILYHGYGALYALNLYTGAWTPLTRADWIKQYTTAVARH